MPTLGRNRQADLNTMNQAAASAKMGDVVADLIANFNALLAKLDTNHGVATDHSSTLKVTTIDNR